MVAAVHMGDGLAESQSWGLALLFDSPPKTGIAASP
jgi:hypothetical protein